MLSLSALFSLALLPAVSLAAPVTPEQPEPIVLEGRGPATAGVSLDALRRRDVGNFDKYAGITAQQLQQGHEQLEKRAVAPGWSEVKLTNQFNSATGAFQTVSIFPARFLAKAAAEDFATARRNDPDGHSSAVNLCVVVRFPDAAWALTSISRQPFCLTRAQPTLSSLSRARTGVSAR